MLTRTLAFTVVAALWAAVGSAQVRLGPQFQVNTWTTGDQRHPKVASDATGAFVVVWSLAEWTAPGRVSGRRFGPTGVPLGDEFVVSASTDGAHGRASLAVAEGGGFVVAWRASWPAVPGPGLDDIYARRYDATGNALTAPFVVNTDATSSQHGPSAALDEAGNFVIVWNTYPAGTSLESHIVGRSFEASGSARTGEFPLSGDATAFARHAALHYAMDDQFVVAWDHRDDGSDDGIAVGVFAGSTGATIANLPVNAYTTGPQQTPAVFADSMDDFVVAWAGDVPPGTARDVVARVRSGAMRDEFIVNSDTMFFAHGRPALAGGGPRGSFLVTWIGGHADEGLQLGVYARLFDGGGRPQGEQFRVSEFTTGHQTYPSATFNPDGSFVVVWQSTGPVAAGYEIQGQRFLPDLVFRDDFDGWAVFPWSSASADGSDLRLSTEAAMKGSSLGLQADVDDTAPLYLQDDTPNDDRRYRARFYFDPSGFDPGEDQAHFRVRLFLAFEDAPARRVAAVVLKRRGGAYSVMGRARRYDNSQADLGFFPISAGPHAVEIDLTAASGPDANDGRFALWIDGTLMGTLEGLDNSQSGVDFVRLGVLSAKGGAAGTVYLDEFESRRLHYIGP